MDLLHYGDDSDREENCKDVGEESRVRTWLTDEEDSDDDSSSSSDLKSKESSKNAKEMLSAEELFAHDIPKPIFIDSKADSIYEIKATTEVAVPKTKAKPIVAKATTPLPQEYAPSPIEMPPPSDTRSGSRDPVKNSLKRKPGTEQGSAKERVKNQRLSGQAGIGSDFKTWRSEEEMRMRQHYD